LLFFSVAGVGSQILVASASQQVTGWSKDVSAHWQKGIKHENSKKKI